MRLALVLTTCAALVMSASPAAADVLPASCDDRSHYANFWAHYTDAGASHQWTRFQYELGGGGTGGKSNVNFWVYENDTVRYWNHSPDNLRNGVLYTVTPPWQVYTAADAQEYVHFEAIFDVFGPDPVCGSGTGVI